MRGLLGEGYWERVIERGLLRERERERDGERAIERGLLREGYWERVIERGLLREGCWDRVIVRGLLREGYWERVIEKGRGRKVEGIRECNVCATDRNKVCAIVDRHERKEEDSTRLRTKSTPNSVTVSTFKLNPIKISRNYTCWK